MEKFASGAPGSGEFGVDVDDVLTSERLELLATRADLAAAPALAASWQLSPAEVRAVQSLYEDAVARNTDRSYTTARRYWHAWYQLRYQADLALPVPPQAVLRFIVDHVLHWDETPKGPVEKYLLPSWIEDQLVAHRLKRRGPWAVNTIEHRVSVLSSMHDETRDAAGEALPNPCRDPYVVRLLRAVRKAHAAHDQVEVRRDAATKDVLQLLVDQCDPSTLRGLRDMAVLLVGFNSGGRRRSELAGLTWERLVADGQNYLWKIGQTKTSDGKDVDVQKPIQGAAAQALRTWREASGVTTGPVFREIGRQERMTARPMSDQAIYRMMKRLAAQADLVGAWGAHSLRAGFMTQAGREGKPLAEAMELSDHSSVLVASRYYRTGAASTSPAANLADGIQLPTAPRLAPPVKRTVEKPPAPRAKAREDRPMKEVQRTPSPTLEGRALQALEQLRALHTSSKSDFHAAPISRKPLTKAVDDFYQVEIEGFRFGAYVSDGTLHLRSGDAGGYLGDVATVWRYRGGHFQLAKYDSDQASMNLSGLTDQGVAELCYRFGLTVGSNAVSAAGFRSSPMFLALIEWVREHPAKAKRRARPGTDDYAGDWYTYATGVVARGEPGPGQVGADPAEHLDEDDLPKARPRSAPSAKAPRTGRQSAAAMPANASPPRAEEGGPVARIRLHLVLVANSKFVRTRPQALRAVEDCLLGDYRARKTRHREVYELEVAYQDEADLDRKLSELLVDIDEAANLHDCFTDDSYAAEIDGERNW